MLRDEIHQLQADVVLTKHDAVIVALVRKHGAGKLLICVVVLDANLLACEVELAQGETTDTDALGIPDRSNRGLMPGGGL